MSILQEMEASLASDAPAYMEFLYRYDPKKKQAFAFYEGDEDASFYHQFLIQSLEQDCELEEIVAGCKNNVLKLNRTFNWNTYCKQQIIFFVDRDLSYWLNENTDYDENVFVTDGYSVENYVIHDRIFRIWLYMYKGFARARKTEIDYMIKEYIRLETAFKEAMIPVMARAIVAKRRDKSIHLSDYKISKNLQFNLIDSHIVMNIAEDQKCFERWGVPDNTQEILEEVNSILQKIEHYCVRGKWLLYFLAELGEYMRLHADFFAPSLESAGKLVPTCSVSSSQCLSVLAPHCSAMFPVRLRQFLQHTYGVYLGLVA